jgi:MFS family permease
MTYGVGWMIAYALLPILVTTGLGLNYDKISESTIFAYLLAMVVMIIPAGLLMDKLGAARSTGLSFAMLTVYPIGLLMARDSTDLLFASIAYGIAHAGANVGWMLGPVSLAPTPEKVPQYVAIHATLVGVRGKLFQLAGIGLYKLSGNFTLPLLIAAAAYAWSAVQMWQLHGRMKRPEPKAASGATEAPEEAEPEVAAV